jgi:hypothetical protein
VSSSIDEVSELTGTLVTRIRDRPPDGLVAAAPSIDLRPLFGGWVNCDEHTTGIHRVEIGDWEGTPVVRVFGAGRPAPIDWGEAAGMAFAADVTHGEAVAFMARYDLGFAEVLLAGYLNNRLLVVNTYAMFTDSSGRADYVQPDHFYLP